MEDQHATTLQQVRRRRRTFSKSPVCRRLSRVPRNSVESAPMRRCVSATLRCRNKSGWAGRGLALTVHTLIPVIRETTRTGQDIDIVVTCLAAGPGAVRTSAAARSDVPDPQPARQAAGFLQLLDAQGSVREGARRWPLDPARSFRCDPRAGGAGQGAAGREHAWGQLRLAPGQFLSGCRLCRSDRQSGWRVTGVCSILGIFDIAAGVDLQALREQALSQSARQRHRGPDWSGVHVDERAVLVHERLAIVDVSSGAQPLRSADGGLALAVNGEIYNHRELRLEIADRYAFQTASDCEVINALYRAHDVDFLGRLNGIFAFALWDRDAGRYLIARDPIGVCPLYMGHDAAGGPDVASEAKALVGICDDITLFPPGHYLDSRVGTPVRYWTPAWRSYDQTRGVAVPSEKLRVAFEAAVHRQLMSDVPYGVLLSGGLDSSLVAACVGPLA